MSSHKYHLAKTHEYKRLFGHRLTCPKCGRAKCFIPYVDENGECINESVGKCDHANSCGYHYPPREYFADNHIMFEVKQHRRPSRPMIRPQPKPTYINPKVFKQSVIATQSSRNNLIDYLKTVFDAGTVNEMVAQYFIGTSKHFRGAATVFFQVDRFGKIHRGKVMQYNPTNGKRVRINGNGLVNTVHTLLNLGENIPPPCLFGEHLLSKYTDMTIGIIESEKTAIITSGVFGDCITLACGGCENLTASMCEPLRGRDVVLFPDNGCFEKWATKGKKLKYLFRRLRIADIMEREANCAGDDIGDLIVAHYQEWCSNPDYCATDGSISLDLGLHEL